MTKGKSRTLGIGVAMVAAFALMAGPAQADDTQTTACNANGLLPPLLPNPSCTTGPINADPLPEAPAGSDFTYTATAKASSLLLPAGVKIEFILNGVNIGSIASCNTNASTCTATFTRSGTSVPSGWNDVRARCTWTNKLAVTASTDCLQTLVRTAPEVG